MGFCGLVFTAVVFCRPVAVSISAALVFGSLDWSENQQIPNASPLPRQAEQAGLASAFNVASAAISCCEIFFVGGPRGMSDSPGNDRASVKTPDNVSHACGLE
jgi:hypothetical protein